jgi:hypothetical protein
MGGGAPAHFDPARGGLQSKVLLGQVVHTWPNKPEAELRIDDLLNTAAWQRAGATPLRACSVAVDAKGLQNMGFSVDRANAGRGAALSGI